GRDKLALTQKQLANLLGVSEATVSRWETGARIQQRAMGRFLRVCLASPAAVGLLRSDLQTSAATPAQKPSTNTDSATSGIENYCASLAAEVAEPANLQAKFLNPARRIATSRSR